jgi:hypothetical protein
LRAFEETEGIVKRSIRRPSRTTAIVTSVLLAWFPLAPLTAHHLRGDGSAAIVTVTYTEVQESLNEALKSDPAVRELVKIRQELLARVKAHQDLTVLIDAYEAEDESRATELLGLTQNEADQLTARLDELAQDIRERFPHLDDSNSGLDTTCDGCAARKAAKIVKLLDRQRSALTRTHGAGSLGRFDAEFAACTLEPAGPFVPDDGNADGNALSTTLRLPMQEGEPPADESSCQWSSYVAALLLCTAFGPWLYWACAWIAYCELCEGELHDTLCFLEEAPEPDASQVTVRGPVVPNRFGSR